MKTCIQLTTVVDTHLDHANEVRPLHTPAALVREVVLCTNHGCTHREFAIFTDEFAEYQFQCFMPPRGLYHLNCRLGTGRSVNRPCGTVLGEAFVKCRTRVNGWTSQTEYQPFVEIILDKTRVTNAIYSEGARRIG